MLMLSPQFWEMRENEPHANRKKEMDRPQCAACNADDARSDHMDIDDLFQVTYD